MNNVIQYDTRYRNASSHTVSQVIFDSQLDCNKVLYPINDNVSTHGSNLPEDSCLVTKCTQKRHA